MITVYYDSHAVHAASTQQMAADSALIMECQTRLSEAETAHMSETTNHMKEIASLQVEMHEETTEPNLTLTHP